MVDLSVSSIVNGYITLLPDTSYNLMSNLVIDGSTFVGVSGGNATTYLNGQGYTISVSGSYVASASFPTQINVSNLTLINPDSSDTWGNAVPDATCYAFVGPLTGPTVVGIADISSDNYIHLSAGNQYLLSEDIPVNGSFSGFKINGTGNVMIDCADHTVTMTSGGGLMVDAGTPSLCVKNLVVSATGVALANGNGWIFGTGFTNMIAVDCHVTCGNLDQNSGGIFGGGNTEFVCATGCSVVCGNIMNTGAGASAGGGGGICGGKNTATISITDCSATITGDVSNNSGGGTGGGGGGGICGGLNNAIIIITNCDVSITGSVTNDGVGGGGGICGGLNGSSFSTADITITSCEVTIGGDVTNDAAGGGGGICGGANGTAGVAIITIINCEVTIEGDVTNNDEGGGGGICGGKNGLFGSAIITIVNYSVSITGSVPVNDNEVVGGDNLDGIGGIAIITITSSIIDNGGGGGFVVPCFLANAPVLTPTGYTKISKLSAGDKVMTGDGRVVEIQKVSHTRVSAGPSVNPYVIPKGLYGATKQLLISPEHRVSTANGMLEARLLGLEQSVMAGEINYYNLELPSWSQDTMVVAGVVVESLAPVRRITMTLGAFKNALVAQYGALTPAVFAKVQKTCRLLADGRVECPVLPKK